MSAAVLDALRNAVSALVTAAPEPIVKRMLRELLADSASAAPGPSARLSPPASPPRPVRKCAGRQAAANGIDAAWEELRRQVRQAMRARGVDYATLGAAIGRSAATTKINVSRRQPASGPVQAALRAWLEAAPRVAEVAEVALPFRSASAGQRARNNGMGQQATARHTGPVGQEDAVATRVHASAVALPHG